jgi:hypothetical protein
MTITRNQFMRILLGGTAVVVSGGTAVVVSACAGSGDDGNAPDAAPQTNCAANGTNVTISANHGHVIAVSASEVAAGVEKTYDIRGTADHTHSVKVTAAHFAMLQGNQSVTVMASTSTTGHAHTVTVVCV